MTEISQQRQGEHNTLPIPEGIGDTPLITPVRQGEPTASSIQPPDQSTVQSQKSIEFQWKFAEETHQYVREYIRQADQKAAFFFAGATALIAFLYKANLVQIWVRLPTLWVFVDMLSFISTIGLSASAFFCIFTIIPRLNGSKRGHIFFYAIKEFESKKDYKTDVLQSSINELLDEKLFHIHDLAKVCSRKFTTLVIGQYCGAVGVVATVILLLFAA